VGRVTDQHTARLTFPVGEQDTAAALGSGDVPALATPRLLAWLEAATCAAAATSGRLLPGQTSVGTTVTLEHLMATAVGGQVEVVAELTAADARSLRFAVTATDGAGRLVARGEVGRAVVDRERFVARLSG
jgi:predicted thioesterase